MSKAEIDFGERFFEVEYEIESDETIYGNTIGLAIIQSVKECFFNDNQIEKRELDLTDFQANDTDAYEFVELYLTNTINED